MAEVAALEPSSRLSPGWAGQVAGRSPWALAGRRLRAQPDRDGRRSSLFLVIVAVSFAAPIYANHIAHINPFENNLNGTTIVNGKKVPLMQQGGGVLHLGETPIGPTWDVHHYFLGADQKAATWRRGCSTAAAARSWSGSARPSSAASSRRCSRCSRGSTAGLVDALFSRLDGRDLGVPGASCSRSASRPCS